MDFFITLVCEHSIILYNTYNKFWTSMTCFTVLIKVELLLYFELNKSNDANVLIFSLNRLTYWGI